MKPEFITFTGVDDHTSIDEMHRLSLVYPIEWGVLFSPKRQGEGRYPGLNFIRTLVATRSDFVKLAAHLCGGDARDVVERGLGQHDQLIYDHFQRVQINTADPEVKPSLIANWARHLEVSPILQCRGEFPDVDGVEFLFDASGGRGIAPKAWPKGLNYRCGYAGGLNPDNVAAAVADIGTKAGAYWIDMETGVRDDRDRFSLDKCQAVCEAVYGTPY